MNLPINIFPVLPQAGAQTAAGGPTALPAGIDGLFARLLDLLGGGTNASGQQGHETTSQQTGSTFFNLQLGDLTAGLEAGEEGLTLTGIADMLGLEIEVDPEQAIAGIAGPLVDLLNSLAARIDTATEVSTEQANAALQLARGLIQSGGNTAELNLDLALQTTGRDIPQQGLAAQLRAAAADLELVRQDIPIPTARAQATAILSGNAPTLDELLNPRVNANANGSGNGGEGSRDGTRLANTLGASLNARADAAVNQPAPTANGAQTLANALADAGIRANVTTQQVQPQSDPLPNPQVTQSGAPTLSSDVSAAARPLQAAYQPPQVNLQHLAFQIAGQFQAGHSRFQIRMDPPELGRIDVRMDVDAHGVVHARLAVDRAETLEMLRHDTRAFERALQQAGLDQNKTNLEFSLRQNGSGSGQGSADHQPAPGQAPGALSTDETTSLIATQNAYRGVAAAGGLNLWV